MCELVCVLLLCGELSDVVFYVSCCGCCFCCCGGQSVERFFTVHYSMRPTHHDVHTIDYCYSPSAESW
jgi:hypothetical protein